MYYTKKIGIWGYGTVGKSAVRYFSQFDCQISIMDAQATIADVLKKDGYDTIPFYSEEDKSDFFFINDFFFISPGINISNHYTTLKHTLLTEIDIFYANWNKPIVAITGTVGKTSITTFLSEILKIYGLKAALGGNIGIGCLDLLKNQNEYDIAVLEVSSFQLEYCQKFAPILSIWTNFFPNHLDRHQTMSAYFNAKYKIIENQTESQSSILPLELADLIVEKGHLLKNALFFCNDTPSNTQKALFYQNVIFYIKDSKIIRLHHNQEMALLNLADLPSITLPINWVIVCAALYQLNIPLSLVPTLASTLQPVEHRIEKVATFNGVDFYNDSKSTTIQATLAAVEKLQSKPIHLFLGGLSKGVNRKPLIKELVGKVNYVYCFGKEAVQLSEWCNNYNIPAKAFSILDQAFEHCLTQIKNGEQVLLSPSGSSYDLFTDYENRGKYFKNLVKKLENQLV